MVAALGISVTPRGTFGYSAWTLELWCVGAAVAAANPEHTRAQWLWRVASVALGTQPGDWTHTMKWSPHSVQCKSIISYRYRVVAHQPCPTPCHRWTAACQASLSSTSSWGFLKRMPIVWLMPSNQLILWRPFSSCPQSLETEKKKVFLLMKTLNIYSLHSFHL